MFCKDHEILEDILATLRLNVEQIKEIGDLQVEKLKEINKLSDRSFMMSTVSRSLVVYQLMSNIEVQQNCLKDE